MNEQLERAGWIAPAAAGPTRLLVIAALAVGAAAFIVWGAFATGWFAETVRDRTVHAATLTVATDGGMTIDGRNIDTRTYVRAGVEVVAGRAAVPKLRGERVRVDVEPPAGVDRDSIAVRILQPFDGDDSAHVLVTVPAAVLDASEASARGVEQEEPPQLASFTDPFDRRVAAERADHRRLEQLRSDWWWIAIAMLGAAVGVPLATWRRSTRQFFSMRIPGAGTEADVAPPSNLDPVGAALMAAGAGRVDHASAFAGHVVDLVERRQLPMRRSTTYPPGIGTLLGLHHADEVADVAVPLLAALAGDGGTSVVLPDDARKVQRLGSAERRAWRDHVASRASFERMVDRMPLRRIKVAIGACGVIGAAGLIAAVIAPGPGAFATRLGVALAAAAAGGVLACWMRDASQWRVVARSRRNERAQWLAWRDRAEDAEGPASDERNLPLLVATNAPLQHARAAASPTAVDLGAVTTKTIDALRIAWRESR